MGLPGTQDSTDPRPAGGVQTAPGGDGQAGGEPEVPGAPPSDEPLQSWQRRGFIEEIRRLRGRLSQEREENDRLYQRNRQLRDDAADAEREHKAELDRTEREARREQDRLRDDVRDLKEGKRDLEWDLRLARRGDGEDGFSKFFRMAEENKDTVTSILAKFSGGGAPAAAGGAQVRAPRVNPAPGAAENAGAQPSESPDHTESDVQPQTAQQQPNQLTPQQQRQKEIAQRKLQLVDSIAGVAGEELLAEWPQGDQGAAEKRRTVLAEKFGQVRQKIERFKSETKASFSVAEYGAIGVALAKAAGENDVSAEMASRVIGALLDATGFRSMLGFVKPEMAAEMLASGAANYRMAVTEEDKGIIRDVVRHLKG